MANSPGFARSLRESWLKAGPVGMASDYTLIEPVGAAYAARTKDHLPAIVIPVDRVDQHAIGRRAGGCELVPIRRATFRFQDRMWEAAGAAFVCYDDDVLDAFQVLAADVIARVGDEPTWASVVEVVNEWQTLLASKGRPNAEGELGLWGELWLIAAAVNAHLMVAAWRGPERDATDFFLGGVAVDVKTSRLRRRHHVSLTQVPAPVGAYPAWLLSMWVKEDPARGLTVVDLVAAIESRCDDPSDLFRRLLRAGYSVASKHSYVTRYVVLAEPEWFAAADVPTIRAADPGVSEVRHRVDLDEELAADAETADGLWKHFCGGSYAPPIT